MILGPAAGVHRFHAPVIGVFGALVGVAMLAIQAATLAAQAATPPPRTSIDPDQGGLIKSMGQPPIWKPYLSLVGGSYALPEKAREFVSYAEVGVFRDIGTPIAGIAGYAFEAYVGGRSGDGGVDGGARALFQSPFLRLGLGVDYNFRDTRPDLLVRLNVPVHRGGLIFPGGSLQLNWLPTRSHSWHVGLEVPVGQPWRGNTSPPDAHYAIADAPEPVVDVRPSARLLDAIADLEESAHWVNRLNTPFIDQGKTSRKKAFEEFGELVTELETRLASTGTGPDGSPPAIVEVVRYHERLEHALSIAAAPEGGDPGVTDTGRTLSARLREIVLDRTIFPYNYLLGQPKKKDSVRSFSQQAFADWRRWVEAGSRLPSDRQAAVLFVGTELLRIIEAERDFTTDAWGTSQLGWIPLQFGLRPEQYDTRAELNNIVERSVNQNWTAGNRVWYVQNAQFQWELSKSIERAEDYHVLWLHDIAAFNAAGDPDQITFTQMVDYYLASLTRAVRRYDETGKLPVFMIFFDQHYYELNRSRLWMNVLESPMEKTFPFPADPRWDGLRARLAAAQAELREAVAGSERLQNGAAEYGEDWLSNRVKVHVNVTQPADLSFWNSQIFPLAGYPDNIMRDHRKIVFYDVSEEDPYRGMAIYSGMGIGEHYIGPTWEDRAVMAQGPALLTLKDAARELLLGQGFAEDEIPYPLRRRPKAANYDDIIARAATDPGSSAYAMELHNDVGYGEKEINVVKAVLYTLMPPGSVIIIPDSLWNSAFMASMLVGNCLRGANVLFIAPSQRNAPGGNGFPQMSRAQELWARLILIQKQLGDEIEEAGGLCKTGLYDIDVPVADVPGSARLLLEGLERNEWLAELMGLGPDVYDLLRNMESVLEREGIGAVEYRVKDAVDRRPQLHLKANYMPTPEAWSPLLDRAEFDELTVQYAIEQARFEAARTSYTDIRDVYDNLREAEWRLLDGWAADTPIEEQDRASVYLIVGSANQDYRSMYMDGEAAFVTTGVQAFRSVFDFLFLAGSATWVDTLEELERLLPEQSGFKWWLGRLIRDAL
ncbi:MAG: hypothetical protein ACC682_09375 [Gemmatimonadota bacterium]